MRRYNLEASAEFGPSGRAHTAPDFYDLSGEALQAVAYPRGAGGAAAWGAPAFDRVIGRGDDFAAALRLAAPADGDRLDIDVAAADPLVRRRINVPDISEAKQSGRPDDTAPPLTADVDWMYDTTLAVRPSGYCATRDPTYFEPSSFGLNGTL